MNPIKTVSGILATVAIIATVAGCGSNNNKPKAPVESAAKSAILYGDCSSFTRVADDYLGEMVTFADSVARQRINLRYGCVDGAPLRSLHFKEVDFGDIPPAMADNAGLVGRFNEARALGLGPKFRAMLRTKTDDPGSNQLEALELAAREPNLITLAMWTDAITNAVEDIDDLATATPAQIKSVVKHWTPRMKDGLGGVTVYFLGVGRGTSSSAALRNAEQMFRGIIQGAGGTLIWREDLPKLDDTTAGA